MINYKFSAISPEATIQQDIDRCRGAVKHRNWEVLNELVTRITSKARRAHEVGENALAKATDHTYKHSLSQALDQLDKGMCYYWQDMQTTITTTTTTFILHLLLLQLFQGLLPYRRS